MLYAQKRFQIVKGKKEVIGVLCSVFLLVGILMLRLGHVSQRLVWQTFCIML